MPQRLKTAVRSDTPREAHGDIRPKDRLGNPACCEEKFEGMKVMSSEQGRQTRETMHALRQPLNVLRLTLANLTHRFSATNQQPDLEQIQAKLELMEEQITRMADLIDSMMVTKD